MGMEKQVAINNRQIEFIIQRKSYHNNTQNTQGLNNKKSTDIFSKLNSHNDSDNDDDDDDDNDEDGIDGTGISNIKKRLKCFEEMEKISTNTLSEKIKNSFNH